MNITNLVKMEFLKISANRRNLAIIGLFFVMNLSFFAITMTYDSLNTNQFQSTLLLIGMLSIIGSFIIMFFYPLVSYSQDYKNNVLALIVASGVRRRDYYFAKTIVIALVYVALFFILYAIPIAITTLMFHGSTLIYSLQILGNFANLSGINTFMVMIMTFLSILSSLIVFSACAIKAKGSYKSILYLFVVSMINQIVISILTSIVFSSNQALADYTDAVHYTNNIILFSAFTSLLIATVYMYFSIRIIEKQDL